MAYFTIGSTKDEVLALQGTPTTMYVNRWCYGSSLVEFYNDKVITYSNTSHNLKVRAQPSTIVQTKGFFSIGSTKDEVLTIQGTPTTMYMNRWYYGSSLVEFYNDKVITYSNTSHNLKIRIK